MDKIGQDIIDCGYHVTVVQQHSIPRYIYTVGLTEKIGQELVLGGGAILYLNDALSLVGKVVAYFQDHNLTDYFPNEHGFSKLIPVHRSWSSYLLTKANLFYEVPYAPALQLYPDPDYYTIDIPDMSRAWDANAEPAWRWLIEDWRLPIPPGSTAVTNVAALLGSKVTEAARWEEDEWELFAGAGPDVSAEEMRVVPIGTLLGVDSSLMRVIELPVGKAMWREATELEWHDWAGAA
jgi:hypothetical protein